MKTYRIWLNMERAVGGKSIKEFLVRAKQLDTAIQIVYAQTDVFPHLITDLHTEERQHVTILTQEDISYEIK